MTLKNRDMMLQIKEMLHEVKDEDESQYVIILEYLREIYMEYNSGTNRNVEGKLYNWIDAEIRTRIEEGML